jgi:HAD superfamily hydrolase (TIGR01509 family)
MPKKITTILFDADGVLQHSAVSWTSAFGHLLPAPEEAEHFMASFLEVERTFLTKDADLRFALQPVLDRFGIPTAMDEVLAVTCRINLVPDAFTLLQQLRQRGFHCCLASNQSPVRAKFMSSQLDFARHFDREFYSCFLGEMKPNRAYFEAILEKLAEPADQVAFVDDKAENVDAAIDCGMRGLQYHLDAGPEALRFGVEYLIKNG